MGDIFISYARKDLDKVRPLAEALEARGWDVWWDPQIRSGVRFDRLIEKELEKARSILVFWSQYSVDSDWVRDEATEGLERNILVSITTDPNLKLPLRFRYIHTELLVEWDRKKYSPAFDKIVGDLEAILGCPDVSQKSADKKKEHPDFDAMVEIPAGEFISQNGTAIIETPFMIDVYPVTNLQYRKFIKAGGYQINVYWSEEGKVWRKKKNITEPEYWSDEQWNTPNHPVVGVSYYEAEAFSEWAGKRLPTEHEWEKAARGTDGREYPWGNEFDVVKCNSKESKISGTTEVTRYPNGTSPYGCYDMVGNIWEWTESVYDKRGDALVLRGGSWVIDRKYARSAYRDLAHPDSRSTYIGFRCARVK